MKNKIIILMLIVTSVFLISCGQKDTSNTDENAEEKKADTNIIKVNGVGIELQDFYKYHLLQSYDFEREFGPGVWDIKQNGKTMREIRQDQTIDYLVRVLIISEFLEGKGKKMDTLTLDSTYDKYMKSIKNNHTLREYLEENAIDESFIKKMLTQQYYLRIYNDEILEEVKQDEKLYNDLFEDKVIRYKTSHILLDDEQMVKEVEKLLNDSENPSEFSELAKAYSIHSTSAVKGGDLDYIVVGNMPKEFEEAVLKAELYTPIGPIKTDYGYHFIFVDDRQKLEDLQEMGLSEEEIDVYKDEILEKYVSEKAVKTYDELKKKATIEINKELLNGK